LYNFDFGPLSNASDTRKGIERPLYFEQVPQLNNSFANEHTPI